MTSTLRRAAAFAVVGSLALAAPSLGEAAAAPFAVVAALALVVDDGPFFELFARPDDRRQGQLRGLAGFSLSATALALLATVPRTQLPLSVFVASVLVLAYGNLGRQLVARYESGEFPTVAAFTVTGFLAAVAGQAIVATQANAPVTLPAFTFLGATAALVAALVRSVLYGRDDPVVMLSVAMLLWLFEAVGVSVSPVGIAVALAVTVALGYVSFALETASVPGMLTGVLLALLALVLGGVGWFVVLISFFAVGGLSTKYRYEEKLDRGVAEANEGARGSGNVLGNSAVALLALLAFAATDAVPIAPDLARLAFAGSVAAAMSDTLSSEIGGLYDAPRLITTLERVDPGTDGGVTPQGELAGFAGAALVALIAYALLPLSAPAAGVIVAGGFVGMTVDSLLGATLEGDRLGNQAVNFLATFAGALASVALGLLL
ncbi:MAG: TIGR00297 family protein [Haloferacaceae archaeon]